MYRSMQGCTGVCRDVQEYAGMYRSMQESVSPLHSVALPEGFFDDPKMDARARNVEYKDPMTEEWEKFQKSIAKETDVCFMYGKGCAITRMSMWCCLKLSWIIQPTPPL